VTIAPLLVSDGADTTPAARPTAGAIVQDLLRQRDELPAAHPGRDILRARGIEAGLPLARYLAGRYGGRGESAEDLYQVASLALVRAVDMYDPTRGAAFASYAAPTITGALKRHFRDTTWRIRPPRRIQELALSLAATSASLAQELGRSPTRSDLATHLATTDTEVTAALTSWQGYHPDSLDAPPPGGDQQRWPVSDSIGAIDGQLDRVVDRESLRPLLAALPLRERRILAMRFIGEMSQSEIATQIGLSQMQISRLLLRSLTTLRAGLSSAVTAEQCPGEERADDSDDDGYEQPGGRTGHDPREYPMGSLRSWADAREPASPSGTFAIQANVVRHVSAAARQTNGA
jgi:RNA polymerase sigma-B factor